MFVQNAFVGKTLKPENSEVWIENSWVGSKWDLHSQHIITGVPQNDWALDVPSGVCIDVVPVGEKEFVARPYGFMDKFKGAIDSLDTYFLGHPFMEWASERGVSLSEIEGKSDLQSARIFPVVEHVDDLEKVIRWMVSEPSLQEGKQCWEECPKYSADEISTYANLYRLTQQRETFRSTNWSVLARNYERSVFYQINLEEAAQEYFIHQLSLPDELPETAPLMTQISDRMFR